MKRSLFCQKKSTQRTTPKHWNKKNQILQSSQKNKARIQKSSLNFQKFKTQFSSQKRTFFTDTQFSLKNPREKVLEYTSTLVNNYNKTLHTRPALHFYVKHIVGPIKYGVFPKEDIFKEYKQAIDPEFEVTNCHLNNLSRMNGISPILYSEMVNPERFQTYRLKNYSFYDGIINLHKPLIKGQSASSISDSKFHDFFGKEVTIVSANLNAQTRFIQKLGKINYDEIKLDEDMYLRFLYLVKHNTQITPEKLILPKYVPSFEIGLFWHAHILDPECYRSDCIKNFGTLLEHTDIGEKHKISNLQEETENAWFKLHKFCLHPRFF